MEFASFRAADRLISSCYEAALRAADPELAVEAHLGREDGGLVVDGRPIEVPGRLFVVVVGKAAVPMARAAEAMLGDLITAGKGVTKDGHLTGLLPERIEIAEARHPIPDERGVAATRQMLELVAGARPKDVVLALVSGGGSALLEAPRPPVTLQDMAVVTDLLLRAGAPITDLNVVRSRLSLVKGGGLRSAGAAARWLTLILSDVLGNNPSIIASGPTVKLDHRGATALEVIERYGLEHQLPESVLETLRGDDTDTDRTSGIDWDGDFVSIVADNTSAVDAAREAALQENRQVKVIWREQTGEAAQRAVEWVDACVRAPDEVDVLLGGGELTVTVRGDGVGGRNTEFALAAAVELARRGCEEWVVASLATDGQDGLADAAGAVAAAETVRAGRERGLDPEQMLAENDSFTFFQQTFGAMVPGPTGTNVNDLFFAVRRRTAGQER